VKAVTMAAALPTVAEKPAATCASNGSLMRMLSAPANAASASSAIVRSGGSARGCSGTLILVLDLCARRAR
jgi:hypothetical protein